MSCPFDPRQGPTRRGMLGAAAGFAGAMAAGRAAAGEQPPLTKTAPPGSERTLPFHGAHQNGIATPMQAHTSFAAFDVTAATRDDLTGLLRRWTEAASLLTGGSREGGGEADPATSPADSGEVLGLPPSRLTLTFGLGPTLFTREGEDRFGMARLRPEAFVDLPRFPGDQLVPERTGGDVSVQACADDPQVTLHAVRHLLRVADGAARLRWVQAGFLPNAAPARTPRNLMGFKDGTANVNVADPAALDAHVWVGEEGGWMRGGSYVVARPIRIAIEHWDRMTLAFQERTIGRRKASGAPIGAEDEFAAPNFDAADADGETLIAENAHLRLAAPVNNEGATILRRGYSYDNGVALIAERWPPWRHVTELDAGLLFVCYQRDPRAGFIKVFERMSRFDMLNQFVTPVGGGLFACPRGVPPGSYLARDLLEA